MDRGIAQEREGPHGATGRAPGAGRASILAASILLVLGVLAPPVAAAPTRIERDRVTDLKGRAAVEARVEAWVAAVAAIPDAREVPAAPSPDGVLVALACIERLPESVALRRALGGLAQKAHHDAARRATLERLASFGPTHEAELGRLARIRPARSALERADATEARRWILTLDELAQAAPAGSLSRFEARYQAARAHSVLEDYAQTATRMREAAGDAAAAGWRRAEVTCHRVAGWAAALAGDVAAGVEDGRRSVRAGDLDGDAEVAYEARYTAIGRLLALQRVAAAIEACLEAEAWARARARPGSLGAFELSRSTALLRLSELDAAAALFGEGLGHLAEAGEHDSAARWAYGRFAALRRDGHLSHALALSETMDRLPGLTGELRASHETNRIELELAIGRLEGLRERCAREAELAQKAGHKLGAARLRCLLTSIDLREGRVEQAWREASALAEAASAARLPISAVTTARFHAAQAALATQRFEDAERWARACLDDATPDGQRVRARAHAVLGEVFDHRKDRDAARASLDTALELAREGQDPFAGTVQRVRAAHRLRWDDPAGALEDALDAVRQKSATTAGLFEEDDWRLGSGESIDVTIGMAAVDGLVARDPAPPQISEAAFALLEAVRGRALRRAIVAAGSRRIEALPPGLREAEASSRAELASARQGVASVDPTLAPLRAEAEARLSAALARREEVLVRVRRLGGLGATAVESTPVRLLALQALLDPATAYVAWFADPERPLALVVRHDRAVVVRILEGRGGASGAEALQRWARILSNGSPREPEGARAAGRVWVDPLQPALVGVTRCIVSLDPRMGDAPLEAAIIAGEGTAPRRWIEAVEIVHVPGASAWLALDSAAASDPEGVLSIGGPLPAPVGLPELAEAAAEAREVAAAAGGGERVLLLGADATLARFVAAVTGRTRAWRWIHVAAHGVPDHQRPRSAGVLLAAGERLDGDRLLSLRVPAATVVLSACESGVGAMSSGEGPLSLARAWLVAGASRVVTVRSEVDDRLARRLMTSFAAACLRDGVAPSRALAELKRDLLRRGGADGEPRVWTAFTLLGRP